MSETTPTVFIIQHPTPKEGWKPNLEPATQYGKLAFVFDKEDRPHSSPFAAIKKARTRLANFDGDRDYLLWPNFGDIASVFVVVALLTKGGWSRLRYLYWSRKHRSADAGEGFYFPVEINLAAE